MSRTTLCPMSLNLRMKCWRCANSWRGWNRSTPICAVELNEFELLYNARVGPIEAQLAEAQLHIDEYRLRIELVQWRGKSLSPIQLEAEVEHRLRART